MILLLSFNNGHWSVKLFPDFPQKLGIRVSSTEQLDWADDSVSRLGWRKPRVGLERAG